MSEAPRAQKPLQAAVALPRFCPASALHAARSEAPSADAALSAAWLQEHARVLAHSPAPPHTVLAPGKHALLALAVHLAFYDHCPLILSPDAVWVTLLQGLAQHCAQAGDDVRAAWGVEHEGKLDVTISRLEEDYLDGGEHDWPGVVTEFSDLVGAVVGAERLAFAECSFSTSSATDKVVSRIALLDCVQSFISLRGGTGCGIPWVALRGTADDWRQLRARAPTLRSFGLAWWCDELEPVLDEFVAAAEGKPDSGFWRSMCNLSGASGGRVPISGWMQALYPYVRANGSAVKRNKYMDEWRIAYDKAAAAGELAKRDCGQGVALEAIPAGLSSAPFTLKHLRSGACVDLAFLGGVGCVSQDPATMALELHTGWAVVETRAAAEDKAAEDEAKPKKKRARRG